MTTDGVSRSKLLAILNGVDVQQLSSSRHSRNEVRRSLGIGGDDLVVGTVARLHPVIRQPMLLNSFADFSKEFARSKLLIVGDGPSRGDIPALLAAMDVFVLCSLTEGLPLTILEAVASGLPVIATDVGSNRQILENGVAGILIPSGSVESLRSALLRLAENPLAVKSTGSKGAEKARLEFDIHKTARQYETLYRSLLASKSNKARVTDRKPSTLLDAQSSYRRQF